MRLVIQQLAVVFVCVFGNITFAVDIVSPISGSPNIPLGKSPRRAPIDLVEAKIPKEIRKEVAAKIQFELDGNLAVRMFPYGEEETIPFIVCGAESPQNAITAEKVWSKTYDYYTLMSACGANKVYSVGVFVIKNHLTNKECIVRLELRLKRIDSKEYDGETFEGTASWSGPFIDDWKEAAVIGSKQLGTSSETDRPAF